MNREQCNALIERLADKKKPYEKHGMYKTAIYGCWAKMKHRCTNPNNSHYKNYGGRGIQVCERWLSFKNFWEDVKSEYKEGLTIERINVNGNYEPSNVTWITIGQQMHNQTTNVYIEYEGERMILQDWAVRTGIKWNTISHRLKCGWDVKRALTEPVQARHKKKVYTYECDEDHIVVIIANTLQEARRIAFNSDNNFDDDFLAVSYKTRFNKDVDLSLLQDLDYGELDTVVGLRLGLYYYVEDALREHPCGVCNKGHGDGYYSKEREQIVCYQHCD